MGFDCGGEDDINQTTRRTNTVHIFMSKETKRHLSREQTTRKGQPKEGKVTQSARRSREDQMQLKKACKARLTSEEWKEVIRLVAEAESVLI